MVSIAIVEIPPNLYCFKDLYIGIIVLVVMRRGFFGHVFRFGFNGQHRKQIEQTGTY